MKISAQQLIILNVGGNDQKQGKIAKPTLRNANAVTLQQVNVCLMHCHCNNAHMSKTRRLLMSECHAERKIHDFLMTSPF